MAWGQVFCWWSFLASIGSSGLMRTLWMSEMDPSKTHVLKMLALYIFWCEFGEWFCSIFQKSHLYSFSASETKKAIGLTTKESKNKERHEKDDIIDINDNADRQNEDLIPLQDDLKLHQCQLCQDMYTSHPALVQHGKTVHEGIKHPWEYSFLLFGHALGYESTPETDKWCKICSEYNVNDTGDFFEEWNEITPQTHIRKCEEQMAPTCWESFLISTGSTLTHRTL